MSLNSLINGTQERVNALVSRVLESALVAKFSKLIANFLSLLNVNAPEKVTALISVVLVLAVGNVVIRRIIALVKVASSALGLSVAEDVSSDSSSAKPKRAGGCAGGNCGSSSSSVVVRRNCSDSSSNSGSSSGVPCANGCGKQKCANGCGNYKCANGCGSSS